MQDTCLAPNRFPKMIIYQFAIRELLISFIVFIGSKISFYNQSHSSSRSGKSFKSKTEKAWLEGLRSEGCLTLVNSIIEFSLFLQFKKKTVRVGLIVNENNMGFIMLHRNTENVFLSLYYFTPVGLIFTLVVYILFCMLNIL